LDEEGDRDGQHSDDVLVAATHTPWPTKMPVATGNSYDCLMAIEVEVQRLQLGDVVLADLPEQDEELEAKVVRGIDRTENSVRVTLRVEGHDDFVKEWEIGDVVTVVRGP
jgi:hypothetical protein